MSKKQKIGTMEIESGKVIISDPCYKLGEGIQQVIRNNVRKGKWSVSRVVDCYGHAKDLTAFHCDYVKSYLNTWHEIGEIGVDAGLAGIYDYFEFNSDEPDWMNQFFDDTKGIIENGKGCYSTSGYGDGGYFVYKMFENTDEPVKEVIGIKIIFID